MFAATFLTTDVQYIWQWSLQYKKDKLNSHCMQLWDCHKSEFCRHVVSAAHAFTVSSNQWQLWLQKFVFVCYLSFPPSFNNDTNGSVVFTMHTHTHTFESIFTYSLTLHQKSITMWVTSQDSTKKTIISWLRSTIIIHSIASLQDQWIGAFFNTTSFSAHHTEI